MINNEIILNAGSFINAGEKATLGNTLKPLHYMNHKTNVLKDKSFAFAVKLIKISQYLNTNYKEFVLSKQLLRSATSVGANVRETNNAESKADFIHKLAIAQKGADETIYWLELLYSVKLLQQEEFESLHQDATELLKIIRSSILTLKTRYRKPNS